VISKTQRSALDTTTYFSARRMSGTNAGHGRSLRCISATANVNPSVLSALYRLVDDPVSVSIHENAVSVRKAFQQLPMIPAMKAAIAIRSGRESWRNVRPPLVPLRGVDMQSTVAMLESGERAVAMNGIDGPVNLRDLVDDDA
jgi:hypothetical protein